MDLLIRKILFCLGLFVLLVNGFAAFTILAQVSQVAFSPQAQCHLRAGFSEWMPYQSISESGKASGLQIDLIRNIVKNVGCSVEFIELNSAESIEQVRQGKLDFIFSATVTEERKKFANFSKAYRNELIVFYVTKNFEKTCREKSLVELLESGFRLGLQRKSFYGDEVLEIQNNPKLNNRIIYSDEFSSKPEFIQKLRLDGIFDDPIIVSYHLRKQQNKKLLRACGKPISTSPVSIMFSKQTVSEEVIKEFDRAIEEIKKTESYQRHWAW